MLWNQYSSSLKKDTCSVLNDMKCIHKHQVRISEHYWKETTDNQSMDIKHDTVAPNALLGIFFIEIRY